MLKISLLLLLIGMMNGIIYASAIGRILSIFEFLPAAQYNQLKPKILHILHTRSHLTRPLYQQARSITSRILDAFSSVVAHDHAQRRLVKRSVTFAQEEESTANNDVPANDQDTNNAQWQPMGGMTPAPNEPNIFGEIEEPQWFAELSESIKIYGFLDIFSLSAEELRLLHDVMTGNNDDLSM